MIHHQNDAGVKEQIIGAGVGAVGNRRQGLVSAQIIKSHCSGHQRQVRVSHHLVSQDPQRLHGGALTQAGVLLSAIFSHARQVQNQLAVALTGDGRAEVLGHSLKRLGAVGSIQSFKGDGVAHAGDLGASSQHRDSGQVLFRGNISAF